MPIPSVTPACQHLINTLRRRKQVSTDVGRTTAGAAIAKQTPGVETQQVDSSSEECLVTGPLHAGEKPRTEGSHAFWQRVEHDVEHHASVDMNDVEGGVVSNNHNITILFLQFATDLVLLFFMIVVCMHVCMCVCVRVCACVCVRTCLN